MTRFYSSFEHPSVFWLLPVVGLALLTALWSWRRRRRAVALLGQSGAVRKLLLVAPRARRWSALCLFVGIVLLLVGSAGPRWGWEFSRDTVKEHDLVVVLDVSRSMLAEQPSRQERALRALNDLADHLQQHGGQRVALVVFAARPHVVFPLTRDYDHFRRALDNIAAGDVPAEVRPESDDSAQSGTRLGAGLSQAVQTLDLQNEGASAIVLLSDGDDPEHDEEWMQGIQAARAVGVPVHTVGIGDPLHESTIVIGGDFLKYDGKIVTTKLEEVVLKNIAERTGGFYLSARTNDLPLGTWLPDILRKQPGSAMPGSGVSTVPILRPRHGWFLWPALFLFCVSILWGERLPKEKETRRRVKDAQRQRDKEPLKRLGLANRPLVSLAVCLLVCLLVAGVLDDDLIRQGNAAFARNELPEALALYEKAEAGTNDPGLVAFNKAAVLAKLDRQREAELHYLRCLEDDSIPATRKAQALFGLGNALLHQAQDKDIAGLDRAVDAFSRCLALPNVPPELATDGQHNLELARWLRMKAVAAAATNPAEQEPQNTPSDPRHKPPDAKSTDADSKPNNGQNSSGQDSGDRKDGDSPANSKPNSKKTGGGRLTNIPDDRTLKPILPEDTAAYLEQLTQRIAQDRRTAIRQNQPAFSKVKDW